MVSSRTGLLWRLLVWSSGILTVLFLTLWIVSYFRSDGVRREWKVRTTRPYPAAPAFSLMDEPSGWWELRSDCGLLMFSQGHMVETFSERAGLFPSRVMPLTIRWDHEHHAPLRPSRPGDFGRHNFLGISHFDPYATWPFIPRANPGPIAVTAGETFTTIPHWLVALVTAIPVLVAGWRRGLRRRPWPGTCGRCGYDLRAHKAGERCPECGTEIPGSARTRTRASE